MSFIEGRMGLTRIVITGFCVMVCLFVLKVGMGDEETDLEEYSIRLMIHRAVLVP